MKTSELIGAHLDYFTGLADGKPAEKLSIRTVPPTDRLICVYNGIARYAPSTYAEKGIDLMGRLISDGFCILPGFCCTNIDTNCKPLNKDFLSPIICENGDTILVAICRAKVASVFGDDVEEVEIQE